MIQFILEILTFQLLFLVGYDLFLKRETFFQWNRFYLIGTFILSIVLPWVKIEALKTTVSQDFVGYPAFIWQLDAVTVGQETVETSWWESFSAQELIFGIGALLAALWFVYKLVQIYGLRAKGAKKYYQDFTKVTVKKSELAFSFFKHIFLGEQIAKEKEPNIIAHELVHIKQWHSIDLLFFELLRIVFWFNPLVYVYQNRVAELHEFIADSAVAKTNKKEQYQLLLSEAFQTQHISFVNQFFKKSLIKKRIVMLSKEKSKKSYQFKYLLLVPLALGMLVYNSCEIENKEESIEPEIPLKVSVEEIAIPFAVVDEVPIFPGCEDAEDKKACFQEKIEQHIRKNFSYPLEAQEQGIQGRVSTVFVIGTDGNIKNIRMRGPDKLLEAETKRIIERLPQMKPGKQDGEAVDVPFSIPITFKLERKVANLGEEIQKFSKRNADWIPFATIDKAPIFPGCENAVNSKSCFQEKMLNHIRKNFNYPKEAQEKGIQGRVAIMFTVDKEGNISNVQKRGPNILLEQESERIINRLPKMKPAINDGQAAEVVYSVPITFKLK